MCLGERECWPIMSDLWREETRMTQDNLCNHQGKRQCQHSQDDGGSVPAPMDMGTRHDTE